MSFLNVEQFHDVTLSEELTVLAELGFAETPLLDLHDYEDCRADREHKSCHVE